MKEVVNCNYLTKFEKTLLAMAVPDDRADIPYIMEVLESYDKEPAIKFARDKIIAGILDLKEEIELQNDHIASLKRTVSRLNKKIEELSQTSFQFAYE